MSKLVELQDVSRVHGSGADHPALDGVSLQIGSGEFTAIMGPSGSGKSTLLNLVAGLDRPSAGILCVDGQDLGKMSEAQLCRFRRERVGFIFQFFYLLNSLTVLENVMISAELAGRSQSDARRRARELLRQLDMAETAGRFPARLSGGQMQRVAVARALINNPVLVLADEPTGALDTHTGEQVMDLLSGLNRGGQTILMVTHDAALAGRYARRTVSLLDGRIVHETEPQPLSIPAAEVVRLEARQTAG